MPINTITEHYKFKIPFNAKWNSPIHFKTESFNPHHLIQILTDHQDRPMPIYEKRDENEDQLYPTFIARTKENGEIFHHPQLGPSRPKWKWISLSDLPHYLPQSASPHIIKMNPFIKEDRDFEDSEFLSEEIIVAPHFDSLTKKWLTTSSEFAKPLLALSNNDLNRFGIQVVFHIISSLELIDSQIERDLWFENKRRELAYMAKRVPIAKGNASFFCVILNLEDPILEAAFIRPYKTLAPWIKPIFVNSKLEILDSLYSKILYDGSHIDTTLKPLVDWYQQNS